jgi:hypothetical protein
MASIQVPSFEWVFPAQSRGLEQGLRVTTYTSPMSGHARRAVAALTGAPVGQHSGQRY